VKTGLIFVYHHIDTLVQCVFRKWFTFYAKSTTEREWFRHRKNFY